MIVSRGYYFKTISVLLVIVILSFSLHYYKSFAIKSNKIITIKPIKDHKLTHRKLIDLNNFRYIIRQNKLCHHCNENFLIVIIIISSLKNRDKRDKIREFWGKVTKCTKLVFVIGSSSNDTLAARILSENRQHGDIIQGNIKDDLYSLSYKHVMVFKWASKQCKKAKFFVKLNDEFMLYLLKNDVLLDLAKIRLFMKNVMIADHGIACKVLRNGTFLNQKLNVTTSLNPESHLPYCWDELEIYSADMVHRLLEESYKLPYLENDKIYVTGVLVKRIGVKHLNFEPHSLLKPRVKKVDKNMKSWEHDIKKMSDSEESELSESFID